MSKRDPEIALRQTLSHSREAVDICRERSRSDLDSDRLFNLALTRLAEQESIWAQSGSGRFGKPGMNRIASQKD
jgi:hypothetical protein